MNKNKTSRRWWLALPLGMCGLGLATTWFAGRQTERQVADIRQHLLERDDVLVNRFEYEAGLFSGALHYDLVWRPTADDPLRALAELLDPAEGAYALEGSLPVRQGPWVGRSHGFAVAATRLDAPMPAGLREKLPQHPGDQPAAVVDLTATWSGEVLAELRVTDYDGRVVDPETGERLLLTLQGGGGRLTLGDGGRRAEGVFQLPRFALQQGGDPHGAGLRVEGVEYRYSATALRPGLWVGDATGRVATLGGSGDGESVALNDITFESKTTANATTVDNTASFRLGASQISNAAGTTPLAGAELSLGLRNIDIEAYVDLLAQAESLASGSPDAERLQRTLTRILAAQPRLSIDRLGFGLADPNDFRAELSIGWKGAADTDLTDLEAVTRNIDAQATARVAVSGLRAAARLYLAGTDQLSGNAAEDLAAVDATLAALLAEVGKSEWLSVTEEAITTELRLVDGQLEREGQPVGSVADLASLAVLFAANASAGDEELAAADLTDPEPAAPASPAAATFELPDISAPPLSHRLQLHAGFEPDPQSHPVLAGGAQQVGDVIEGCSGFINPRQPDVVIDYQPEDYLLSIYAESAEDTSLVIHAPDGNWYCSDDYEGRGFNPAVGFDPPPAGTYAIWVGSISGGEAATTLHVSEGALD